MGFEIKARPASIDSYVQGFLVGERVQVDGRDGEFVVVDVDPAQGRVELLRLKPTAGIESDIPAMNIKTARGPQAVVPIRIEDSEKDS